MTYSQYLAVRRRLLKKYLPSGTKVLFNYVTSSDCSGEYEVATKTVSIYLPPTRTLKQNSSLCYGVLYVLSHEIKHAIHHHQGRFSSYYHSFGGYYVGRRQASPLPDPRLALRAERDCNRFAITLAKEFGFQKRGWWLFSYVYEKTAAFDVHIEFARHVGIEKYYQWCHQKGTFPLHKKHLVFISVSGGKE